MNRLEQLRELLNERGEATRVVEKDLLDVHRRARRHQRPTVMAGALASIVVVATVALAAAAIGVGGGHRGEQVRSAASGPKPTVALSTTRVLSDGTRIAATLSAAPIVFGPYGQGNEWIEPASCPADVIVDLSPVSGAAEQVIVRNLNRELDTRIAMTTWPGFSQAAARSYVAVVTQSVAGATYRLTGGGQTLDTTDASGRLLVLVGSTDAANPPASLHVQQIEDGVVVRDQIVTERPEPNAPDACTPPTSPSALKSAPARAPSADVSAAITALVPRTGSAADSLSVVENPSDTVRAFAADDILPADLGAAAEQVHLLSPTHVWVRYGLDLGATGSGQTSSIDLWAELHLVSGTWKASEQSFCALTSALGTACPGSPSYSLVPTAHASPSASPAATTTTSATG